MPETLRFAFPPKQVTGILRIEGLVAFCGCLAVYQISGGNWWLFAALILVPDLSMLGMLKGPKAGAWAYNLAHTYTLPGLLAALGYATANPLLIQLGLIWAAHIGIDRAVGYGLKYPTSFYHTHLGPTGKAKKDEALANAA